MDESLSFTPDWMSAPGDTIIDLLEERAWTEVELARQLGLCVGDLSKVLKGSAPIDESIAVGLAKVFGNSAEFWLRREENYQNSRERIFLKLEELDLSDRDIEDAIQWARSQSSSDLTNQTQEVRNDQ
jgi:plasmid maintenance system antidote protein VapI